MNKLNQALFKFEQKQNFAYDDFFVSKCNYFAFSLIETWPKWEKNILNIYGEKFSGKSHLSEIFKKKNKAIIIKTEEINNEFFNKIRFHENIILDNIDYISDEKILYSLINFVEQYNKYLIINSINAINSINFSLTDLKSRLKNCIYAKIDKPDDDMIFALILKHFSDRQIKIEKKIIEYITKRIERSYGKILDFIYKVDQFSLINKKPIDYKSIKIILEE
ncbi:DnaA/Hda family protein [Candidatus Pelagibacter sp.]|nr:DnaA/Hda family protein [Candidatus Pelagibacter sp.]